jgi:hypothetical protein
MREIKSWLPPKQPVDLMASMRVQGHHLLNGREW